MINDFLIISCTGKKNSIGLKVNNNFFKEKLQNNINSNNQLVGNIINLLNKYKVRLSNKYSIIVNMGPGCKVYGYKSDQLSELKLENIEILIKNKQLKNKMINPIYQ